MEVSWYQVVSLIISTLALPTIVGLVWKDLHEKKRENSKIAKEKKKLELQENIRAVLKEELVPIRNTVESMDKKIDLVSDGTLCSLRNDIKNCFYACVDKGYRNDYDFKNIHDLYKAYVALDGNSFVDDLMARFDMLPAKEEYTNKIIKSKNTRIKDYKDERAQEEGRINGQN